MLFRWCKLVKILSIVQWNRNCCVNRMSSEVNIIFFSFFPLHSFSFLYCVKVHGCRMSSQFTHYCCTCISGVARSTSTYSRPVAKWSDFGDEFPRLSVIRTLKTEGFGGNLLSMTTVRQGTLGDLSPPRDTNPWTFMLWTLHERKCKGPRAVTMKLWEP